MGGAYTRRDRALPRGYQHPATTRQLAALAEAAATSGLDAGQVALAWMAQRAVPVIPVVGVSSLAQLHSAAQAVATPLPAATIAALDQARNSA